MEKEKNNQEFLDSGQSIFIFFLYCVYEVKKETDETEFLTYVQIRSRIRALSSKNSVIESVLNNISSKDNAFEKLHKESYSFINSLPLESIKEIIIKNIYGYFNTNHYIDNDLENLNEHFMGSYYGDVYIASIFVKKYLFEKEKVNSVTFDFYDEKLNIISSILFELNGISYRLVKSASQEVIPGALFDTVIYFPPYKYPSLIQLVYKDGKGMTQNQSFEFKVITRLLMHLREKGLFISTISTGILNKDSDISYKRRLSDKKSVDFIIELPRLKNLTNPVSMMILRHESENIKMIDASKFAQNIRRGINLDSQKIIRAVSGQIEDAIGETSEEYLKQNSYDLTPHRFFENIKTEFLNPTPLKELVKVIYRGFQIPSSMLDEYLSEKDTKIKLLTLSDIEDSTVNRSTLQSLKGIDKKMEHYIIKENDLVISCKGKAFKTAVINVPYSETYISTGSIIVIRCDESKIDPTFLKIFLDSKMGIEALKRIQTGATILSLNPTKMMNIVVPLPSLAKQLLISSSYKYKLRDIVEVRETIDEMKEAMNKKFDDGFLKLINN